MDIDIQYARALMQINRVEWLPILEQLESVTGNTDFQDLLSNPFVAYGSIIELLTACIGSTNQKQKKPYSYFGKEQKTATRQKNSTGVSTAATREK